ncbi:hypothetical protein HN481_01675 [Candidatus Parcubacteria bacterium]|nr:hypothetical protein [Candidatus Parcubacteria bacterium]
MDIAPVATADSENRSKKPMRDPRNLREGDTLNVDLEGRGEPDPDNEEERSWDDTVPDLYEERWPPNWLVIVFGLMAIAALIYLFVK